MLETIRLKVFCWISLALGVALGTVAHSQNICNRTFSGDAEIDKPASLTYEWDSTKPNYGLPPYAGTFHEWAASPVQTTGYDTLLFWYYNVSHRTYPSPSTLCGMVNVHGGTRTQPCSMPLSDSRYEFCFFPWDPALHKPPAGATHQYQTDADSWITTVDHNVVLWRLLNGPIERGWAVADLVPDNPPGNGMNQPPGNGMP